MLVIRQAQMDALRLGGHRRFEGNLARHLRATRPDRTLRLDDDGMSALVRDVMRVGMENGIDSEGALREFAHLWITFGAWFELSPSDTEAIEILRDPDFPGELKVLLLDECLGAATGGRLITPVG